MKGCAFLIYYIRCARSGFLKGEAFRDSCPARAAWQAEIGKADLKQDCVGARDTAPPAMLPLLISRDLLTFPGI